MTDTADLFTSGKWRDLPEPQKRELAARLAEKAASMGHSLNQVSSPGLLSLRCDPRNQVQRAHLRLIDDALAWVLATPDARLFVTMPPQSGKSWRISRWFPFWWLTLRPQDNIVIASYGKSLASTHTSECRDFVEAYGAEHGLYLRGDTASKSDWRVTAGGSVRARGTRAGLVGFPMDLGIIDDPYRDRADVDSPKIRENVWNWYSSAFSSRMAPGARVVLTMTRWHQDDLAGRLLKRDGRQEDGGKWRVLHLPAIAQPLNITQGFYPDPLGRAPGEPLPHPELPEHDKAAQTALWMTKKNDATDRDWSSTFLGVPTSAAGAVLSEQDLRDATGVPVGRRRCAVGIDPAGKGTRDTVGIVAAILDDNRKVWWTHNRTGKLSAAQWPRVACLLAHEVNADRFVIEANYGGDMPAALLAQEWEALQREGLIPADKLCPLLQPVTARVSKVLRLEPIAQALKRQHRVGLVRDGLGELRGELTLWEPGSTWSPGGLDAAVHVATELLPDVPRGSVTESIADTRLDQVEQTEGGLASMRLR